MENRKSVNTDPTAEVVAKLEEYFDRFNKEDVDGIIENVYAPPMNIGLESGVRVLFTTEDDVRKGLAILRKQLKAEDWVQSVILNVDVCVLTDGLVFADVTYQQQKADNQPIPPDICIVYVLQNLENKGWRIISFYIHDLGKEVIAKSRTNDT